MDRSQISSNWKKLQATLKADKSAHTKRELSSNVNGVKRKRAFVESKTGSSVVHTNKKRRRASEAALGTSMQDQKTSRSHLLDSKTVHSADTTISAAKKPEQLNIGLSEHIEIGKYIALDCEMVGVGPPPSITSILARVSIVNYHGEQIYDSFVVPTEPVTDHRTPVSGIVESDLVPGKARPFKEVQKQVADIIKGRIVVGHALRNDFGVLGLDHSRRDLRDTARYQKYRDEWGNGGSPKLKVLASELLGLESEFQGGMHSSVEDARAALMLYKRDRVGIDQQVLKEFGPSPPTPTITVRKSMTADAALNGDVEKSTNKKKSGQKKKKKKKR